MSLFPAYGQSPAPTGMQAVCQTGPADLRASDENMRSESDDEQLGDLSPGAECLLLAEPPPAPAPRAAAPPPPLSSDFYLDRKLDRGNLRVSTLYYPARPEYRARDASALGVGARAVRAARGEESRAPRAKRYWRRGAGAGAGAGGGTDGGAATELAQRGVAFRQALEATPNDEDLWLRYIDFLEWSISEGGSSGAEGAGGAGGAGVVEAARAGAALNPRSHALRSRLHAALTRAHTPAERAVALRDMRDNEPSPVLRAELFAREVSALACAGELSAARDVTAAAVRDRALAQHHHLVLLVFGCVLRSAGLWEQLVQLVELLAAMHLPQSDAFPPAPPAPPEPAGGAPAEEQLAAWEARALSSGLPVSAVWARVERARAALHWRAPAHIDELALAADPQRAPPSAALAELLAPAPGQDAAFRLLVALLRLAETPLLPASAHLAAAAAGGAGAGDAAADWEAGAGLTLLALVSAARRLPPAHPARAPLSPRAARDLLARTPLRTATVSAAEDDTGFGVWVRALWDAALGATSGARRLALLCWRLRVLHARALVALTHEERRSVRAEAREALRRWAGGAAAPFAVFARVEAACDVASIAASDAASIAASDAASIAASDAASIAASDAASIAASDAASIAASDAASIAASDAASIAASDAASIAASDAASIAASDAASIAAGKLPRGLRAALQAARHALRVAAGDAASQSDVHTALYAARIVHELSGPTRSLGWWALACACLGRALPDDAALLTAPGAALLDAARARCARECGALEAEHAHAEPQPAHEPPPPPPPPPPPALCGAMLPGAAEWAAARALLAPPQQHEQLLRDLIDTSSWRVCGGARYREQAACALVARCPRHTRAGAARALAPLFPNNAYLALVNSGIPAWQRAGGGDRSLSLSHPRTEPAVWAALLPSLLRAAQAGWAQQESLVVYRACSRALSGAGGAGGGAGGAGGALLHALRCETAPDPRPALTYALANVAHCKWVLVRGAALGALPAAALAELALERGLRLHALPDELLPPHAHGHGHADTHARDKPHGETDN